MKHSNLLSLGIVALSACAMNAQVLYEQNFDALASSSSVVPGIGGYGAAENVGGSGWQIQGGNGAGTISLTAGINANGVGGSQALFGTWDNSTGLDYTWNQYTYYGVGAAGAGGTLANINISLDLYMSGSSSTTPITIHALQNDGNSSRDFTPMLIDGQYTHVNFTLDQTTASGAGVAFDPTLGFWFRVAHGAGGFGFDAGNTVQIDNVKISVVPEPATAALAGIGAAAMLIFRRRQS
jgi:hypothetical protein